MGWLWILQCEEEKWLLVVKGIISRVPLTRVWRQTSMNIVAVDASKDGSEPTLRLSFTETFATHEGVVASGMMFLENVTGVAVLNVAWGVQI